MSNIDTMIERELKLNTSYFDTDNNTGKAFHNAWNAFYNMSLIVLVLIGLIMVFSQAFSVGPFDAYTIRKVMPRIIIAVIGIVLSWSIMQYLVDLSNIAGNSMRAMIYFPFQSLKNPVFSAGVLSVALLGGSAAIGTVGLLGMLAVFGAGAIALMVGVATIIFREALVMVLVVLSPIAIVFSILPNTQRIWKMWSSNFIRALVAFPIITGMIAVGSAMSRVFTAGDQSAFHQIAAFASVYAPFFMLPAAFRLAGGAIGSFNGVVKNKAAPAVAGLNRFRNKQASNRVRSGYSRAQNKKAFQGNQTYSDDMATRRGRLNTKLGIAGKANARGRLNSGLQTAALTGAASKNASILNRKKFKESMSNARNATETSNLMAQLSNNPDVISGMEDENILKALQKKSVKSSAEARLFFASAEGGSLKDEELKSTMGRYESMRQALGPSAERFGVFAQGRTSKEWLNNAAGWEHAILAANNGDMSAAKQDMILGRRMAAQAGRFDLSNPSIGSSLSTMNALAAIRPQAVNGVTESMEAATARTISEQNAILNEEARIKTTPQQLMQAKEGVIEGFALGYINKLNELEKNAVAEPANEAAQNAFQEELAAVAGVYDSLSYSAPTLARTFGVGNAAMGNMGVMNYDGRELVDSTGADARKDAYQVPGAVATGGGATMKQRIDVSRVTSDRFGQVRLEYPIETGGTAEEQERNRRLREQSPQGDDQQNSPLGGPRKLF